MLGFGKASLFGYDVCSGCKASLGWSIYIYYKVFNGT